MTPGIHRLSAAEYHGLRDIFSASIARTIVETSPAHAHHEAEHPRPETAMQSAERFIRKMDMAPEEAAELFEIVGLALSEWCEANKKHEGPLFSNLATLRRDVLEIGTGSLR